MNDKKTAFLEVLSSKEGEEILSLGKKIKELTKKNDKKVGFLRIFSAVTLTAIGFLAFRLIGAVIFFFVAFISGFFLLLSSKKNDMLRYFTYYRSRIPKLIALSMGVEVKNEEPTEKDFISTLSEGSTLSYRMSHRYGDMYIGYAKFLKNGEIVREGLLYEVSGESAPKDFEEKMKEIFPLTTVKAEKGRALLFIEGIGDYLAGSVEKTDDLEEDSLLRQLAYYLIGDAFKKAANGEEYNIEEILNEI